MKTINTILLFILALVSFEMKAQLILGIEGGVSKEKISNRMPISINKGQINEYTFNVRSKDPVIQFGIFVQKPTMGRLNVEYKLMYNQHALSYAVMKSNDQMSDTPNFKTVRGNIKRLSLSTNFVYSINNFEISLGLVTHYVLDANYKNFSDIKINQFQKSAVLGTQGGIAFNVEKLRFGLQYQLDFDKYGSAFSIQNRKMHLQKLPGRLIFSIGFQIGKLIKVDSRKKHGCPNYF